MWFLSYSSFKYVKKIRNHVGTERSDGKYPIVQKRSLMSDRLSDRTTQNKLFIDTRSIYRYGEVIAYERSLIRSDNLKIIY